MRTKRLVIALIVLVVGALMLAARPSLAQDGSNIPKPLRVPFAEEAGPSTWLFGQAYGNTVGAFNFGQSMYSAGQGLHFGLDFPVPCGTPVVAMADGEVAWVDNLGYGSGPHNVVIRHADLQLMALYGHLLERSPLIQGQPIRIGEQVGLSGDPDLTCQSRPHLHLELRSPDMLVAYNPVNYIDAEWHQLATMGGYNYPIFQQDLMNARRWLSLQDQPDVHFRGQRLNDYRLIWPPLSRERPIDSTSPYRDLGELSPSDTWQLRQLTTDGCCARFWWQGGDEARLMVVDGLPQTQALVIEWDIETAQLKNYQGLVPAPLMSADGAYEIQESNGQIFIHHLETSSFWSVETGGLLPTFSPNSHLLLWAERSGQSVPGGASPTVRYWVSEVDGTSARVIFEQEGGSAWWLDDTRLLVNSPIEDTQQTSLTIFDMATGAFYPLGTWERLRGIQIAPGGERIIFYLSFQAQASLDGMYSLEMQAGAIPQKLPWFGGYRWRDARRVFYLPYDPAIQGHQLAYYDVVTGENRILTTPATLPFTVANGDWSVAADGEHIVFQNADDMNLWLLEIGGE